MATIDWNLDEDGKVEAYPLVAYETLVAHEALCGLKISYLVSPEQLTSGETASIPLIMTPDMARRLAGALLHSAEIVERGRGGELAN